MSKNATTRKRQKERKARAFARAYHSEERVVWVKQLNCVVCGRTPCDNAHTETGGTGRKAGYKTIVPLCSGVGGHHNELHATGIRTFEDKYTINLRGKALRTQGWWLDHQSGEEVMGF